MKLFFPLIVCILLALTGCQTNSFGACVEQEESVTPNCLYNGNYPACDLNDSDYLIAQQNAWSIEAAGFSEELHIITGQSQDLGEVCRYYVQVKPEINAMEPYQWMVYINKKSLAATHYVPVLW